MRKNKSTQSGMTFIGGCIIALLLGSAFLLALAVFPLYNEYFKIRLVAKEVAVLPAEEIRQSVDIHRRFLKLANVHYIERLNQKTIKDTVLIYRDKQTKKKHFTIKYQATNKLFGNLYMMLDVDDSFELVNSGRSR